MRKFPFIWILILLMLRNIQVYAQFSGKGTGNISDPYLISNVKEFKEIENVEGDEYTYIYFRLVNDIDLAGECQEKEGWKPLVFSYSLQLDGNNKTIYGLNINRPNENKVGLFSRACGEVNNLTVVGQVVGKDSVGGFAGCSRDFWITNCTFKGKIIGNNYVGGFIGKECDYHGGRTENCVNEATITGKEYVGGFVGHCNRSFSKITQSVNLGDVSGTRYVGGFAGASDGYTAPPTGEKLGLGIIESCNNGNVLGEESVGGFIGNAHNSYVKYSMANGIVKATKNSSGEDFGGICGYATSSSFSNNCSNAEIIGYDNVGGIIGRPSSDVYTRNNKIINKRILGNDNVGRAIGVGYGIISGNKYFLGTEVGASGENACSHYTYFLDSDNDSVFCNAETIKINGSDNSYLKKTDTYPYCYLSCQTPPPTVKSGTFSMSTTIKGTCQDADSVYAKIGRKVYSTPVTNEEWTIVTYPLRANDEVLIYAKKEGSIYSNAIICHIQGKGSEENPYIITTAEELANLKDGYCQLGNDIDLTDYIKSHNDSWTPIQHESAEKLVLDGDGHRITGLSTNATEQYAGLFGSAYNIEIRNLSVEMSPEAWLTGTESAGVLVGKCSHAKITKVTTSGCVRIKNSDTRDDFGRRNKMSAGGMIGDARDILIEESCAAGKAQSNSDTYVGGLVGTIDERCLVRNCYSTVDATSANIAAGVVGSLYPMKRNQMSESTCGDIRNHKFNEEISCCYASGKVEADYAYGIVGANISKLTRNFSLNRCINGNVQAFYVYPRPQSATWRDIDSMENRTTKDLEITENGKSKEYKDYYNKDGDYYGLQLGDYEAKRQEVYSKAKWDFESIWAINKNVGYPYFKWQTAKPIVSSEVKEGATTINGKGEEDGIIFVKIAGKEYSSTIADKAWSIEIPALQEGDQVVIYAQANGKMCSNSIYLPVIYKGEGTEESPYLISTPQALANISDGYYQLANDIDLTDYIKQNNNCWQAIQHLSTNQLTLDGNGHKISGLQNETIETYAGLFGLARNVTIENMIVEIPKDATLKATKFVGILIAKGEKVIINRVGTLGSVTCEDGYAGGIIGYAKDIQLRESFSSGNVMAVNNTAGGLVGQCAERNDNDSYDYSAFNYIENCYSLANVKGTSYAGGLVGDCPVGSIRYSYASGEVTASSVGGGIVGRFTGTYSSRIERCFALNPRITVGWNILTGEPSYTTIKYGRIVAELAGNGYCRSCHALYDMVIKNESGYYPNTDREEDGGAITIANAMSYDTYHSMSWDFNDYYKIWAIQDGKSFPYLQYFKEYIPVPTAIKEIADDEHSGNIKIDIDGQYIKIKSDGNRKKVMIFGVDGRKIASLNVVDSESIYLPKGIYIVKVGKATRKIDLW